MSFCQPGPSADECMLSPSARAAQRIYSAANNHRLSFHAAMQNGDPSAFHTPPLSPPDRTHVVEKTVESDLSEPTFDFVNQRSNSNVDKEMYNGFQEELALVKKQLQNMQQMFAELTQYHRQMSAVAEQQKSAKPNTTPVAASAMPSAATATPTTPSMPNRSEKVYRVPAWQIIVAAVVFLFGILRIIEWLVALVANAFWSQVEKARQRQSSSSSAANSG